MPYRAEVLRSGGLSLLAHLEMDTAAALEAVAAELERDAAAQAGSQSFAVWRREAAEGGVIFFNPAK